MDLIGASMDFKKEMAEAKYWKKRFEYESLKWKLISIKNGRWYDKNDFEYVDTILDEIKPDECVSKYDLMKYTPKFLSVAQMLEGIQLRALPRR